MVSNSFQCLKDVCDRLRGSGAGGPDVLAAVAGIAGSAIDAESFSIHALRLSPLSESLLECLGLWIHPRSACFPIENYLMDLSPEAESGASAGDHGSPAGPLPPGCRIRFRNLRYRNDIFGFMVFCTRNEIDSGSDTDVFLDLLAGILELWIENINQSKNLTDILNYLPQPTFMMNPDEEITFWNRATEVMTGWNADRIVGKPKYESGVPFYGERRPMVGNLIMYPDPRWEVLYHEYRREEGGDVVYSLAFCTALHGVGAYLATKTARLYDVNGRLSGSIHTVRDLTLERNMEKNLQRSESMYRAIADFAGMGILLAGGNGIIYCNKQFRQFIGIGAEAPVSGEEILSWVLPEDRALVKRHLLAVPADRDGPMRFEFKSGAGRYYRALAQIIEYEGKPAVHLILDDVTEQKSMAEKARLNELKLYHQDRLTALGVMAAGIAHELNQPLNTIRVVADGFLFGREQGWGMEHDELFESLEMVSRQVIRMTEVIQNIRDFSREDRDRTLCDVAANHAFNNVFSMIGRQLEAHGIEVYKDFAADLPPVRANLYRLEQVIMNLLVNARQALDRCQSTRKVIRVRTSLDGGRLRIEVSDNAGGIPPKIYDRIFQPFFTTKEAGMGTGLGLSICQSIVEEFNGRFEVYNNEMSGATFTVVVPVEEPA